MDSTAKNKERILCFSSLLDDRLRNLDSRESPLRILPEKASRGRRRSLFLIALAEEDAS